MKNLNVYISEKLVISKKIYAYKYYPKTKEELQDLIIRRIEKEGPECDLNDIDVSTINDMSELFNASKHQIFEHFNGDISKWDVSEMITAYGMFERCKNFDQNISKWNICKLKDATFMFYGCESFNQDLSNWDVSGVKDMFSMFENCKNFNGVCLESWKIDSNANVKWMFNYCKSAPSWWDK